MRRQPQRARLRRDAAGASCARRDGTASYYAFAPRKRLRFISLDTVAEGGGQNGNLDDPQYRWLKRELRKARKRDQLVVVFGHHTLATMSNAATDEEAGACAARRRARLRRRPAPLDAAAPRPARRKRPCARCSLRHPNVIAYVAGHTHDNEVTLLRRQARARLLGDQHRLAHRLAAAEPADRGDGQPRRDAVDLRHDPRQRRAGRGARAGPAAIAVDRPSSRRSAATLSWNDPQREAEGGGAEPTSLGGRRTATSSCWCATRASVTGHKSDVVDRLSATLPARWTR